ncbi:MAG TPA: BadF/BadG/BcrA/BcrD ATPase family protein, partial [Candidatus Limnocylindria bacterium]|nr:BadF/BadG/BcrA/BcrD ATPase family protein [Candidatus Limnocylindria bacterium]
MTRPPAAVLAVDGGNSKADLALVARDGRLLSAVRGPTISHQQVGFEEGTARLRHLADAAARRAGVSAANGPLAEIGLYTVAGADFASETRTLARAFAAAGLTRRTEVLNDTLAALRAGTDHPFGVVLICGAGVNAAAVGPSGRTARLAALGPISGDRGGGRDLGMSALGAAVRARDGRGPRTAFEQLVPAHFGLKRPDAVTRAIYDGRIPEGRVLELAPVVFTAASGGDTVARDLLDRLADELGTMAIAMIRRA